jgi:putative phosphoribosyl transferase
MIFEDRQHAGRILASRLKEYGNRKDVVVLGLPRGGIPVAFEVARALSAPLDVFVVRKLGVPNYEELAMGAIASGGVRLLNEELIRRLRISAERVDEVSEREGAELARRERAYRDHRLAVPVEDRTVILVDDGLATGFSMRAAVQSVRRLNPARVVVAVPTAPLRTCEEFKRLADECVCVSTPAGFEAVGQFYRDFGQTTDEEVRDLLAEATVPATFTVGA